MSSLAEIRSGKKKETHCIRELIKAPALNNAKRHLGITSMYVMGRVPVLKMFCILFVCLALFFTACKPVPKDRLTLLFTGDTTGQIEPCG
jgi:hypothetical protein